MRNKLLKSEVAKLLNITKAAVRYYEDKGIMRAVQDENGYRLYDWAEVEKLDQILFLKDLGLPMDDIKDYIEDKNNIVELLGNKKVYIDQEVDRLVRMRERIDNILALSDQENILLNQPEVVEKEERMFYMLKELNSPSIKDFYKVASEIYQGLGTVKEELILLHENYDGYSTVFANNTMLLAFNDQGKAENLDSYKMPTGKYLTIKYVLKEIKDFIVAYNQVIDFAKYKNLKVDPSCFVEFEYKNYSVIYKEKMYELQFKILE